MIDASIYKNVLGSFPSGVTAWRKGVLICAAPDILYAEDTDGDGRADIRRTLFSGFATTNYQARVNSLTYGLDGWVHGANGLIGGRIASFATCGVDPSIMGIGPAPASRKALAKAGWSVGDLDLIEANEAFAAQALSVSQELGFDPDKVNVNGGAIAIGHPIGASGARVLTTLLYEMDKRDAKKGLATLCIGGGMGVAMCIER